MNTKIKSTVLLLALGALVFTSCKKDEPTLSAPKITLSELGHENEKVAYAGTDLHVEAEIIAEAKIKTVTIEIHKENEESKWELDTTFTEFEGQKNADFHKHIDIPVDVEKGEYHFHFKVVDMQGNETVVEEELEIKYVDDNKAPTIVVSNAPTENKVFKNGETISISGMIEDDYALGGVYVGLVDESANIEDSKVNFENSITLLHTHHFEAPKKFNFEAKINVGVKKDNNTPQKDIEWKNGNYYLLVKCKDAFGGNGAITKRYPIVVEL